MFKAIAATLFLALSTASSAEVATVVETYDNIVLVESHDGNLWEYEFENMTDQQLNCEKVLMIGDDLIFLD